MKGKANETINTDVLIIGSGLAGMLLALELSQQGFDVLLASKGQLIESNTAHAQGGLAAVTQTSRLDSPRLHLQDTIKAGAGLTDETVAWGIIKEGAALVRRLTELGMAFDQDERGNVELALEGGHSEARVLHSKDTTGLSIAQALIRAVVADPAIIVIEDCIAVELIFADGRCSGAYTLIGGKLRAVRAGHVVLATGGLGQVFSRTTNPEVATGDGIALAYRAGARVVDMEFVQFHPTALCKSGAPAFLISEAVRGAGAQLLDANSERFAFRFHPKGELGTRDIVSRAIHTVMMEQGTQSVALDLRPIGPSLPQRFPNIIEQCRRWNIDPLKQPVPVAPAAHYFMGGIWTDQQAMTSLPGLYAIGECASTGLHGANRLASNSLLEAGVMALRLARCICEAGKVESVGMVPAARSAAPYMVPGDLQQFRSEMYNFAGLERNEEGLRRILDTRGAECLPVRRSIAEAANIFLIGKLIATAALLRRESRGAHFRSDYSATDDNNFLRRFYLSRPQEKWLEQPVSALPAGLNPYVPA